MDPELALRETFGLVDFRPGQRAVVDSVLSGRPTIAVMPTGAGKSLCYQLPAVVAGGTTLVVSPLIALMKDQVDALVARGVRACAINSSLGPAETAARLDDLASGRIRLAYVAPERFRSPRFEEALSRIPLSLLAVDEAHCISEWGHDFRPDYMRLGEVVERYRPPRVVALTATATPEVRRDIQRQLGLGDDAAVFVRGFDRPNLHFSVEQVGGEAGKTARLVEIVKKRTGPVLVYAATRKNAESYAAELASSGIRAGAYHAGMAEGQRSTIQDAFMGDDLEVIVATNAFGMGVDKSDVRMVIHADLPRSPEAYYQEAGRGGRDGAPADCVILFNHGDVKLQEFLIEASSPSVDLLRALWRAVRSDPRLGGDPAWLRRAVPGSPSDAAVACGTRFLLKAGYFRDYEGVLEAVHPSDLADGAVGPARLDTAALAARADVERGKLRSMVDYVYSPGCRRRFILTYFGDEDAGRVIRCGHCDTCARVHRPVDGEARMKVDAALALAARLGGRFGRTRIAAILAGDDDDDRFAELPSRGVLRRDGTRYALSLLRALEGAGLLVSSGDEYPTLSITAQGKKALAGQEVSLAMPDAKSTSRSRRRVVAAPAPADTAPADPEILERLRGFRRETAARESVPAYCVFADKTLEAIARARPRDLTALGVLPGIGPAKLAKYGPAVLEMVRGAPTDQPAG